MASRRQPEQEEGSDDRKLQDSTQAEIARALRNVLFPSMAELRSRLEPLIRRVVQEEVSSTLRRHLCQRNTLTLTERYGARAFQLCFMNKLPSTTYTSSELAPIQIALCDATSQNSIVRSAPQSFIKIEICPLDGDFSSDDWTANEFNAKILKERHNKAPLLCGDKFITLENGTGFISKINFTDNSCWTRSRKFRIGARVVDSAEAINIREARSDPLKVLDRRGEAYKKYDRPSLNDPIWRLKKIGKTGKIYKHLSSNGIATVKDLLHLHMKNPALFEQICGSIPRKARETIIEHAYKARETIIEHAYLSEGLSSVALERELSPLNDYMAIDEPSPNSSMNLFPTSLQVQAAGQSSNPDHQKEFFSQPYTATSHIGEGVHNSQEGSDEMEDLIRSMLSPAEEGFGSGIYIEGISFQTNYHLPSTGNGSYFGSGDCATSSSLPRFSDHASSSRGNRRTLWRKIRNALKWVGLYAAKRNQIKLFPIHNY